jgi:hypothetical protein
MRNKKYETDSQQQAYYNERNEKDAGHARQVLDKVHEMVHVCAAGFDDLTDRSGKVNHGDAQVYDKDSYDNPKPVIDGAEYCALCVRYGQEGHGIDERNDKIGDKEQTCYEYYDAQSMKMSG